MEIIQFFLSLHDPINVNSINNRVSIKVFILRIVLQRTKLKTRCVGNNLEFFTYTCKEYNNELTC